MAASCQTLCCLQGGRATTTHAGDSAGGRIRFEPGPQGAGRPIEIHPDSFKALNEAVEGLLDLGMRAGSLPTCVQCRGWTESVGKISEMTDRR